MVLEKWSAFTKNPKLIEHQVVKKYKNKQFDQITFFIIKMEGQATV